MENITIYIVRYNGIFSIVDYSSPHALISSDYQIVIFVYSDKKSGISHIRSKKIGNPEYLWDISTVILNGTVNYDDSFTDLSLLKIDGDYCFVKVINQVNRDIFIRVNNLDGTFSVLKNYAK